MTTKHETSSRTDAALLLLMLCAACGSGQTSEPRTSTDGSKASAEQGDAGKPRASVAGQGAGAAGQKAGGAGQKTGGAGSRAEPAKSDDAGSDAGSPNAPEAERVNLGMAGDYVILAKSGISVVPTAAVTGDLGVSPAAATAITGFSLTADSATTFSTSAQVTGKAYAADYAQPTPANLTKAVSDMEHAFTDAAGRMPTVTELGAGDITAMTLERGVYKWGTGLTISNDLTFKGSATDLWILQVAGDLTVSSRTKVILAGGALAKNVFWQVAGKALVGTSAHIEGVVLSQTAITLNTGASINGRLLAQTAVVLDSSTVVEPD
jgi:hypothetical protein